MTLTTLATVTMIATAACMTTGCGDPVGAAATEGRSATPALTCAPVKVALIADKSQSAPGTRTPEVTLDDVESLIEVVASCGGELAFGVIHDRITDPFVRLRLDARPQKPSDSIARNVIRQRREQAAIEGAHANDLKHWEDEATLRIERFGAQLMRLVDHPADAKWSPVWDSVARGDLFLAERELDPAADARRVLMMVSDAVDDMRGVPAQRRAPLKALKSGATLLIVNGAGTAGSLAALEPEAFESFAAAVRYIAQLAESPRPTKTVVNNK